MPNYSAKIIVQVIDKATAPIRRIGQSLRDLGRAASLAKIGKAWDRMTGSIGRAGDEMGRFAGKMAVLGGAGVALFAAFIKPASAMENLRVRLNALYGSIARGGQMFDFITDFAVKSPYSFQMLADSLATLKGMGFGNLNQFQGIMNFLGTRVPDQFRASNAILAISQAWGLAKLQMQDIRQLIQAGVPVWDLLQEVTGQTTAQLIKMSEAGELNRGVISRMFDLMGKKAKSAGDQVTNLFTTKLSNLFDAWDVFSYRVMNTDLGGMTVFQEIKNDIQSLTDAMRTGFKGESGRKMAQTLAGIYHGVKQAVIEVIPAIQQLSQFLDGLAKSLGGYGNLLKAVVLLMGASFAGSLAQAVIGIGLLIGSISSLLISAEFLSGILWILLDVFFFLTSPIGLVITGIALLAGAAFLIARNWGSISQWFVAMWQRWGGLIRLVMPGIGALVDAAEWLRQNWSPIEGFFSSLCTNVTAAFQTAAGFVQQAWAPVKGLFDSILGVIRSIGQGIADAAANLPNVNSFTGRPSLGPPMPSGAPLPARPAGMAALSAMARPGRDTLDIAMRIDAEGRPVIQNVRMQGDKNLNFRADMGVSMA